MDVAKESNNKLPSEEDSEQDHSQSMKDTTKIALQVPAKSESVNLPLQRLRVGVQHARDAAIEGMHMIRDIGISATRANSPRTEFMQTQQPRQARRDSNMPESHGPAHPGVVSSSLSDSAMQQQISSAGGERLHVLELRKKIREALGESGIRCGAGSRDTVGNGCCNNPTGKQQVRGAFVS